MPMPWVQSWVCPGSLAHTGRIKRNFEAQNQELVHSGHCGHNIISWQGSVWGATNKYWFIIFPSVYIYVEVPPKWHQTTQPCLQEELKDKPWMLGAPNSQFPILYTANLSGHFCSLSPTATPTKRSSTCKLSFKDGSPGHKFTHQ